jgi:hypothetical protein
MAHVAGSGAALQAAAISSVKVSAVGPLLQLHQTLIHHVVTNPAMASSTSDLVTWNMGK